MGILGLDTVHFQWRGVDPVRGRIVEARGTGGCVEGEAGLDLVLVKPIAALQGHVREWYLANAVGVATAGCSRVGP